MSTLKVDTIASDTTPTITISDGLSVTGVTTSTGNIDIGNDTGRLRIGAGADLQSWHNGTNSFIKNTTGRLDITSTSYLYLESDARTYIGDVGMNEPQAIFIADGAVELFHDNSKKFETTSGGIKFTGNIYGDDNAEIRLGDSGDFQFYHHSSTGTGRIYNSNAAGILVISDLVTFKNNAANETLLTATNGGAVELYYDNSKKLETSSYGAHLGDSVRLTLGGSTGTPDCHFYGDGSNTNLQNITGDLIIKSNSDGDKAIVVKNGAGTELYHDNTKRLVTTNQGVDLEIAGSNSGVRIHGVAADVDPYITFRRKNNDGGNSEPAKIVMQYVGGTTHESGHLDFMTNPDSGSAALNHRFRISNNGDLLADDTSIGSLSDSRLKKNVADYTYDLSKFKQIKPKTFDWINPKEHIRDTAVRGFLAQELKTVDDYWISENGVANREDIKLITDGKVLTSKLGANDAMYVSVINQLIAKIETLETKVAALESA